jgi:hypothetical protein
MATTVVALALLAAACGSGDDAATTTVTATLVTTTTASTTTTLPPSTSTTAAGSTTSSTPPSTLPPSKPFVTTVGLAGVSVGMTVEEAEEASGHELVGELDPTVSEVCYFVIPTEASGLTGITYMVFQDLIARVDVSPPSETTTRSGAGIGLDADLLFELFPGQIEEAPQFTIDGLALMYVPQDEVDSEYRIIFDVVEGRVAAYRSGILPGVGFGEGCL